jgi:hypothetical protein
MVKKSSKVTAHFWIARQQIHQRYKNLNLQDDFLCGWALVFLHEP